MYIYVNDSHYRDALVWNIDIYTFTCLPGTQTIVQVKEDKQIVDSINEVISDSDKCYEEVTMG